MKKRILSLFLTVAMMLSVMAILPISVSAEVATFDGETNLTIYNNADIARFDEMVTAENDFSGKTVTLGNNLTLLSTFDGIGEAGKRFAGTFDGQGYTITCAGHTVKDDYGSFFVGLDGATIKDVTFEGNVDMNGNYSATVACSAIGTCLIQNVRVSVYMQSISGSKEFYCGGFISCTSSNNDVEITFDNCVFDGTMNFANQAGDNGGFIGITSLSTSYTRKVVFENCVYAGTMSFNDKNISEYSGCFAGYVQQNSTVVVNDCYSIGNMTFVKATNPFGVIIGEKNGKNTILTINNFYYVPFNAYDNKDVGILQGMTAEAAKTNGNIASYTNVATKTLDELAALTAENSGFSANATFSFKANTDLDTYYPCPTGLVKDGAWVDSLKVSVDAKVLGASIRITAEGDKYSGIRFEAKFRETVTKDAGTANANFGLILISKTAYETWSALEGENKTFAALVEAGVKVSATKATTNEGIVTVKAVVYEIDKEYYEADIVAIPYANDTVIGDEVARSIYSVAKACVEANNDPNPYAVPYAKEIVKAVEEVAA